MFSRRAELIIIGRYYIEKGSFSLGTTNEATVRLVREVYPNSPLIVRAVRS
jgi:hypothetical protein